MKKSKKPVKNAEVNTVDPEKAKKHPWFDYRNIFTGLMSPMSAEGIKRLSVEVVQWAESNEDALKISQFYLSKGVSKETWTTWCNKYPELLDAHNTALEILGNRREIGAIKNSYNYGPIGYMMPAYDQDWKNETVRKAALKESGSESKAPVIVNMMPIPNSPLVPERDSDE